MFKSKKGQTNNVKLNEKKGEKKENILTKQIKLKPAQIVIGITTIAIVLFAFVLALGFFLIQNSKKKKKKNIELDPELARAMTYDVLDEHADDIEGTDCVKFSAFFLRDIDSDGNAERLNGTARSMSSKDIMYIDFNVITEGYLKNASIQVMGDNFIPEINYPEDDIVKKVIKADDKNYLIMLQENILNGTQKLFEIPIKVSNFYNIDDYSKNNRVSLQGTYVNERGEEISIIKDVNLMVDWYGTSATSVKKYYDSVGNYSEYEKQSAELPNYSNKAGGVVFTFDAVISETDNQLFVQKQLLELELPELLGKKPTRVSTNNNSVNQSYDRSTGKFTIIREAEIKDGIIVKRVNKSNIYKVSVFYELDEQVYSQKETIMLDIPVFGENTCFNNINFENPVISSNSTHLTILYELPGNGKVWNIETKIIDALSKDEYGLSNKNIISKYNGSNESDLVARYEVDWDLQLYKPESVNEIIIESGDCEGQLGDVLKLPEQYISMYDSADIIDVDLDELFRLIGETSESWVRVYNENNEEIAYLTGDKYDSFKLINPVKKIKIITSKPIYAGNARIRLIKDINLDVITQSITKEEFIKTKSLLSKVNAKIVAPDGMIYDNGTNESELSALDLIDIKSEYSSFIAFSNKNSIGNQVNEQYTIEIQTEKNNALECDWKNGIFLVEFPSEILDIRVLNIEANVSVSNYVVYEENDQQYLKIYLENDNPQKYKIVCNLEIVGNPTLATLYKNINVFGYNEFCEKYKIEDIDLYDLNNNGNIDTDECGCFNVPINIVAPSSVITTEYITNFNEEAEVSIPPKVAELDKELDNRRATVNVSLANNYYGTITDVKILGNIPFVGNKYYLQDKDLGSTYNTNMIGKINVPEEISRKTKVYYSENVIVDNNLNNESNNWKLADDVSDWSTIKTYLIDLKDHEFSSSLQRYIFSYDIEIPDGLANESVSFANHVVYFSLNTYSGKYKTKVEPTKVGIGITSKYSLEIEKNNKNDNNVKVENAAFTLEYEDFYNKVKNIVEKSNENGLVSFDNLNVGRKYSLKELSVNNDYELDKERIVFTANYDENGNLILDVEEGEFDGTITYNVNEEKRWTASSKIENEVRYDLQIVKYDEEKQRLPNISYAVLGKGVVQTQNTDNNGIIDVYGLYVNEEYHIQERRSDDYYLDDNERIFKLVRNDEGNLVIETEDEIISNAEIRIVEGKIKPCIVIDFTNEKIPTYNLEIMKVEENPEETDISKLKPLENSRFSVESFDTEKITEYTTNENGIITIPNMYLYIDGKNITGLYTIKETKSPEGYANDNEEIKLVVKKENEELSVEIENRDELKTIKDVLINEDTVRIILQDKPLFKLIKTDKDTGKPIPNVAFTIYELDENGNVVDFAKDVNNNYVGKIDESNNYIVVTDENGIITLPLRGGVYKAVEMSFPEGYEEKEIERIFKIEGQQASELVDITPPTIDIPDKEKIIENEEIIEVNNIEDLVSISNGVKTGNTYAQNKVKLMRKLDFRDDNSYEDSSRIDYGDLNSDGTIETIKEELLKGKGFQPIGNYNSNKFEGYFDGNGFSIENIYIEVNSYAAGLFGGIHNAEINNLSVSGTILNTCDDNNNNIYVGGIVGFNAGDCIIKNCTSSVNVSGGNFGNTYYYGGIVGYSYGPIYIKSCENIGIIDITNISISVGGIIGYVGNTNEAIITDCKNKSDFNWEEIINNYSNSIGGIIGSSTETIKIDNCINEGNFVINGNANKCVGGIIGKTNSIVVNGCKNEGAINVSNSSEIEVGGIVGYSTTTGDYTNCLNEKDILINCQNSITYAGGIVGRGIGKQQALYCKNRGNIESLSKDHTYLGGIAAYGGSALYCENSGNIKTNGNISSSYRFLFRRYYWLYKCKFW